MTRQTISLHQLICSELVKDGFNELENEGRWTFFDSDYSLMQKILKFDNDVQKIVNEKIFLNEKLVKDEADYHFKKTFIQKFVNKTINRQTIESFSQQVVYTLSVQYDYINQIYDIEDFLLHKTKSEHENTNESQSSTSKESQSNTNNENTSDNRVLDSELPQSEINLNVDDTVLNYGNRNTISRNKDRMEGESTNIDTQENTENAQQKSKDINYQYDLEKLIKVSALLENVYHEFDKNCFMQAF